MNEQEKARHALDRLKEVETRTDKFKGYYRSYVDRLGPAILINGLGQALAMELAAAGSGNRKGDDEQAHDQLYRNVRDLLCQPNAAYGGQDDLMAAILGGGQDQYIAAQAETLSWLSWHKKFCQAYLPREEDRP
jgi:CRISPR-associated protein Cmr5